MAGRKPATLEERFWEKVQKSEGCWLWTGTRNGKKGYGMIWSRESGRKILAHRASYVLANGPIAKSECVLHRCDNPLCVNPGHLFLGTVADNNRDMTVKGRRFHALTVKQVRTCRHSPKSARALAREWNVDKSVISDVRHGRTYQTVL